MKWQGRRQSGNVRDARGERVSGSRGGIGTLLQVVVGIFGVNAVMSVLNTFSTELFPTAIRSDAFAWANNLLGRVGYILAPILVGRLAEELGWGRSIQLLTVLPLLALVPIFLWMPETNRLELEESSQLAG